MRYAGLEKAQCWARESSMLGCESVPNAGLEIVQCWATSPRIWLMLCDACYVSDLMMVVLVWLYFLILLGYVLCWGVIVFAIVMSMMA